MKSRKYTKSAANRVAAAMLKDVLELKELSGKLTAADTRVLNDIREARLLDEFAKKSRATIDLA